MMSLTKEGAINVFSTFKLCLSSTFSFFAFVFIKFIDDGQRTNCFRRAKRIHLDAGENILGIEMTNTLISLCL